MNTVITHPGIGQVANPAEQLAAMEAQVLDRILLRASRESSPSARLTDREREQVDNATLDYIGMDLCASLDDCTDQQIGAMLRAEHERRVLEALANR